MFALIALLSALWLFGAVRRGGLAAWLALVAGFMTAFGGGQPTGDDWLAAGLVTLLVFVGVRLAQSWGRSHEPVRVAMARERMAGRAVHRRPASRWYARTSYEAAADESDWLGEEVEYAPATARRPGCERRR